MFYLFIADGTEEVEALATLDVLRHAGIETKTVGIGSENVTGSHNITIKCDTVSSRISFDSSLEGIIIPGGMPGTLNIEKDDNAQKAIKYCVQNGLLLCAICAAPSVYGRLGLLEGKNAVCFPGFEKELKGAVISREYVCRDGNFITAKGMGCAILFGLKIVEAVKGKDFADKLKSTLQCAV